MTGTSSLEQDAALSAERVHRVDVHAALQRSQDSRRTLLMADAALQEATSAFDTGLDEHVSLTLLSLLDADVESATAAREFAVWSSAESEAALIGAAARPARTAEGIAAVHRSGTFPAAPRSVAEIRGLLRRQLVDLVDEDVVGDIEVMASEVATNCVRHDDAVVLTVEIDVEQSSAHQTTVTVTVSGGHGGLSNALVRPAVDGDPTAVSGRGLAVLDSLAHVWGTQRRQRRTSVWFAVTVPTSRRLLDPHVAGHIARAVEVLADAAAIAADAESLALAAFDDAARIVAHDADSAVSVAAHVAVRAVEAARRARAAAEQAARAADAGRTHLRDAAAGRRAVYDPSSLATALGADRTGSP